MADRRESSERDLRERASRAAFGELDSTAAAPMVACFRAVAAGYPALSYETLLTVAWACFAWEREGVIPSGERVPFEWVGRQRRGSTPEGSK